MLQHIKKKLGQRLNETIKVKCATFFTCRLNWHIHINEVKVNNEALQQNQLMVGPDSLFATTRYVQSPLLIFSCHSH